jgi:Pheophorbide a oxygenase
MSNPVRDVSYQGFTFTFQDRTMKMKRNGYCRFRAPYYIEYRGTYENIQDKTFNLTTLLVPSKPGWSRIIIFGNAQKQPVETASSVVAAQRKSETKENNQSSGRNSKPKSSLLGRIFQNLPIWIFHQLTNRFLDSDLAFLHFQEKERNRRRVFLLQQHNLHHPQESNKDNDIDAIQNYYRMPTASDRSIVALRKWIQQYAPYVVEESMLYYNTTKHLYTDRTDVLFNHYVQHTDQCQHCNQVYHAIQGPYKRKTYLVLAVSILLLPIRKIQIISCCSIVICIGLLQIYHLIIQSMTRGDFKHYENN